MRPTCRFPFFFFFLLFYFSLSVDAVYCVDLVPDCEKQKELCDDLERGLPIRQRCGRTCGVCETTNRDPCIDLRCVSWFQQGNCTFDVPLEKRRRCPEIVNKMTNSGHKRKPEHHDPNPRPRKKSKHHYGEHELTKEVPYGFFKKSLNESVHPCDDFYKFTCDEYIARHPFGASDENFHSHHDLQKLVKEQQKRAVLNENHLSHSRAVNTVLLFRDKCLDVESIERNSVSLWRLMQSIGQGVPMFSATFDPNQFDLEDTLIRMAEKSGIRVMYKLKTHKTKDGRIEFMVEADDLIMSSNFYSAREIKQKASALMNFLIRIMSLIWKDQNSQERTPNIRRQVADVIDHDSRLAVKFYQYKMRRSVENGGPTKDERPIRNLKAAVRMINWDRYLMNDSLLSDEVKTHFTGNPVILHSERILKEVDAVHRAVDKRVLANYLFVRFIVSSLPFFDLRFLEAKEEFLRSWNSATYTPKRKDMCYGMILNIFPLVTDHIYLKQHMKQQTEKTMERMSHELRIGMFSMFHEAKWMSDKMKTEAVKKLEKMRTIIGAMDDVEDEKKLDERYGEVQLMTSDSLLQMSQKLQKFHEQKELGRIVDSQPYALSELMRINEVNTNYVRELNMVFIRASMLQAPFFDFNQPAAVSYGRIGYFVGHEMTHGFDKTSLKFDEDGERRSSFDEETKREFNTRCDRLIHLYDKQMVRTVKKNVNGSRTLDENIADFGGIRAAFKAYRQHLGGERERHVSGYGKYTNEQTFFIAYGTSLCASLSPHSTRQRLATGVHAPTRFRVNVVLANFPEFAEVFECKPGTQMNPERRVSFW